MMKRSGMTLLELMVAMVIVVVVTISVGRAFSAGLDFQRRLEAGRGDIAKRMQFEDRLRNLLRRAILSSDPTDTASFFQGHVASNQSKGGNADTLIFIARSLPVPGAIASSKDDFETLNQKFGPYGGTAEIQLSTTPVGDQAQAKQGLFIRQQIPADGDPTQGGQESLLTDSVQSIGFEFFDGLAWRPTWDTQTMTTKRIPAAIRVTYSLTGGDASTDHIFVIRLPLSDVTPTNPVSQTGATP